MPDPALPSAIDATADDLPPAVREAVARPAPARRGRTTADGIPFAWRAWGPDRGPTILLVHGITSSSASFWRVGPALAATGRRVVAVDQPGHGGTGHWTGHHRWRDNAADLAAFLRAAGLADSAGQPGEQPEAAGLAVVGHSWGAMTVAALPAAGLRPDRIVLLDPPAMSLAVATAMTLDPVERRYDDLDEAVAALRVANPDWPEGDILAKAEGLHAFEERAAADVLLRNGDWDAGLADLSAPEARGIETWIVRGEPAAGGLLDDVAARAFIPLVGADHILTIAGGAHSPQRTRIEATVWALLRAIGLDGDVVGSAGVARPVER